MGPSQLRNGLSGRTLGEQSLQSLEVAKNEKM